MIPFMIVVISIMAIASIYWQFWVLFDVFLAILLIMFFSEQFRNIFNIHSVVISLIALYALPSSVSILYGKISMTENEMLTLFSAIGIGLIGYAFGVWFLKKLLPSKRKRNVYISNRIHNLFWLTYKHRLKLTIVLCIVLYFYGFMPSGMSYTESVEYRFGTPGVILYFNELIPSVISSLSIAMVSIIGDLKRRKHLSPLSYLLITLVVLSIVGGHRIWIIGLFACLMMSFQPYLKRRHLLCIVILGFFSSFLLSGAVRAARSGETFSETAQNFYSYFANTQGKSFTKLMWGWTTLTDPFSTFIIIVQNIPKKIDFDHWTYLKDASLVIPTVIYPDRPLPRNIWFVKTFDPELFHKGAGRTFYALGFGYLFAGVPGVFVHLFLFGILFEWFNRFLKTIGGGAGLFLYSYFFIQLLRFVVGSGYFSFIKASFVLDFFIPLFLLFLLTCALEILSPKNILCGKYFRWS